MLCHQRPGIPAALLSRFFVEACLRVQRFIQPPLLKSIKKRYKDYYRASLRNKVEEHNLRDVPLLKKTERNPIVTIQI
jgi:hypothetical protein